LFVCFHRKNPQGEAALPENKKAKTAPSVAPDPTPVAAPAPDPVTEETYFCAATQAYDWDDSDEEPDLEMFM